MYQRSAQLYDAIYDFKDYRAESERLLEVIRARAPGARTLLDVACGSGKHLEQLAAHFEVQGLDLEPRLLAVARARLPQTPLHQGDMRTFRLEARFDAVTCLFSAIGYAPSLEAFHETLATFAAHLEPGGLVLVEPWFTPEQWRPGTVHTLQVEEPELTVARMNLSEQRDNVAIMDMHHLVGTPAGVEHFVERHEMTLFRHQEYLAAFAAAGLTAEHDPQGLMGRGLYLGRLE